MSQFFQIRAEESPRGSRQYFDIEGRHRWQLPNRIGCPTCGVYGALGPSFPTVDLSNWDSAATYEQPSAVSWSQFVDLADAVLARIGRHLTLAPGTEFGAFVGRVSGTPSDFIFGPLHLLFATPEACSRLGAAGVALPAHAPAELRDKRGNPWNYGEFEVPCLGAITKEGYEAGNPALCDTCGRQQRPLVRVVFDRAGLPSDVNLVRPQNHATILLASARFVAAVRELELTGLHFEEVESRNAPP